MGLLLVLAGAFAFWSYLGQERFGILIPTPEGAAVAVFENSDPDFQTPPFEDSVWRIHPDGTTHGGASGFNLCETVGGCRALGSSPDGRWLLVCENASGTMSLLDRDATEPRWRIGTNFSAGIISSDGTVYALTSTGTIYGESLAVVGTNGHLLRREPIGGFDLALDEERQVIWVVGKDIKRCDRHLNVQTVFQGIGWCAVSVDVAPDGSVWVAERERANPSGSPRLHKFSPAGQWVQTIELDFSPMCVRVDRSNGHVWITGARNRPGAIHRLLKALEQRVGTIPVPSGLRKTLTQSVFTSRTCRFDADGVLQTDLHRGGFSLAVDPSDGSVWLAGWDRISHHDRKGRMLGNFQGRRIDSQKYIVTQPHAVETK